MKTNLKHWQNLTVPQVRKLMWLIDEKSSESITANTEKKITSSSRNMTSKACQVNFDKINIANCYRSGCQALQNKKMAEEKKFLREQISEKKLLLEVYFRWNYPTVIRIICFIKLGKILMAKICLKVVLMMKSPSVNV